MAQDPSLIAYAFVKKGIRELNPVTQMKLQKMVYFAHGYHLAKYGTPLVNEQFEAWKYGPVIPSIYETYRFYGSASITDSTLVPDVTHLEIGLGDLPADVQDAIDYTWEATKDISAMALSDWTHKAGSPWAEAFRPDTNSIPIKNDRIEEYFTGVLDANA